ncbi:nuclear transport factor 2 family protein [Nocardiopsis synnemataformans]|uniref:nuclear transport factor 2 family protein n=1 Tax=Nocardiopsis synnemataformans TaxID=61305 RepID=UPI003EB84D5F
MTRPAQTESVVRSNFAAQEDAMVRGDGEALGALLADGFTLTHMTGYRQTKAEWLDQVRTGEMAYHRVENVDVAVDLSGGAPVLLARTRTEATIWGAHGTWRLRLRIRFAEVDGVWLAAESVASIW